jgi:restriction system protein
MPIPSQKDIRIPLLHLIHVLGGASNRTECCHILADYFHLSKKEREELQPSGIDRKFDNRVAWARNTLCDVGFLDRSRHGVWQITVKGTKELARLGLSEKPFPVTVSASKQSALFVTGKLKQKGRDIEELFELVLAEIAPNGPKKFPDDFIDNKGRIDFYEV